jgi:hypothetical protein
VGNALLGGAYYDAETRLYFAGQGYFDPAAGRRISMNIFRRGGLRPRGHYGLEHGQERINGASGGQHPGSAVAYDFGTPATE